MYTVRRRDWIIAVLVGLVVGGWCVTVADTLAGLVFWVLS